jgi:hypothetical protein
MEKTELQILKEVKFMFDIHSDHSTQCNGYRSLCKTIEEMELKQAKVCIYCNGTGITNLMNHGDMPCVCQSSNQTR